MWFSKSKNPHGAGSVGVKKPPGGGFGGDERRFVSGRSEAQWSGARVDDLNLLRLGRSLGTTVDGSVAALQFWRGTGSGRHRPAGRAFSKRPFPPTTDAMKAAVRYAEATLAAGAAGLRLDQSVRV